MEISLQTDFKQLTRKLKRIERKQIPFAAAGALTDTAFQSKAVAVRAMPKFLDRPTPATMKGLLVRKAKKTHLESAVFFKPFVWKYMRWQVLGGTRTTGRKIAVPGRDVRLNKYGNIPGKRGGLVKGGAYIRSMGAGRSGIFKKKGKRETIRAILVPRATYKITYPFHLIVERAAKKRFRKNFEKSMDRAMRTAR